MNARHCEDDIDDSQTTNIINFPLYGDLSNNPLGTIEIDHEHGCLCNSVREFERTPNSILDTLDIALLLETAQCKSTPPWLLNKLADSYWKEVRTAVANNSKALIYTLLKLAFDFDADVRYQLAENENVPMQILTILERDDNPYVSYRAGLTANKRRLSAPKFKSARHGKQMATNYQSDTSGPPASVPGDAGQKAAQATAQIVQTDINACRS